MDALVDGFLIGLSYVANYQAGFVMAAATCVEMGYVLIWQAKCFPGTVPIIIIIFTCIALQWYCVIGLSHHGGYTDF